MLGKIYKVFAFLLIGFVGGTISPWFMGWMKAVEVAPSDAVSIANTYIVFTTIIFVGVTVLLAIAGYVFTQQFSASKSSQEHQLLEELKEKIKGDERIGISLADSILNNPDVIRHLEEKLGSKVNELLQARLDNCNEVTVESQGQASATVELASRLEGGNSNE